MHSMPASAARRGALSGDTGAGGSLREAVYSLVDDHEFLLAGDVFTKEQIDGYLELKWEEIYRFEHAPHPIEFQMYYSS